MSDEKNKRFKANMSFEDALKKAATTKVNPAIMVEGTGKEYAIPGAAGKKIQFVQVTIADKPINHFSLKVSLIAPQKVQQYMIPFALNPHQKSNDTVQIHYTPISVPANTRVVISIESSTNENFEVGSVTYKIL